MMTIRSNMNADVVKNNTVLVRIGLAWSVLFKNMLQFDQRYILFTNLYEPITETYQYKAGFRNVGGHYPDLA